MPERVAILCSDIHLSDKPPIARCDEKDWYEAMARPLRELRELAEGLPVLCGGDVFDRWKSPPKLINFAMQELPLHFYSVMGQHDLPYHSWDERESSAFWTLHIGRRLKLLAGYAEFDQVEEMWVRGFHWGQDLVPNVILTLNEEVKIAVAHKYVWAFESRDESVATENNCVGAVEKSLEGFDVVLFGDNHKYWKQTTRHQIIFNPGTFMRRRTTESDHVPVIGILYENGELRNHFLDTSSDVLSTGDEVETAEKMVVNMDSFVQQLRVMQEAPHRFSQAIERALEQRGAGKSVRRLILEAMEGK